jgi:hypothetical protein
LELFILLIPEAVLLLVITLAVVILLGVVVLIGRGVELLPLGTVSDEVGGVFTLEAVPRRSPPLLAELCKAWNFIASKTISSYRMLLCCSSEAADKTDKQTPKQMRQWCWWG